jgi:microsomal dipeptidase-like Zn-dependent dipeptidase
MWWSWPARRTPESVRTRVADTRRLLVEVLNAEIVNLGFRPEHRIDYALEIDGFRSWREWPNLTQALVERGYGDVEIRGFPGESFRRVFEPATGP